MSSVIGILASYTVVEYKYEVFSHISDLFSILFPLWSMSLRRKHGHICIGRTV